MLYMLDICYQLSINDIYHNIMRGYLINDKPYKKFSIFLFKGVCDNIKKIDYMIKCHVKNWEIQRMAIVDRNIIRIAIFEIFATLDTPINVIIDEAVEISKKYSTANSSKFVNGVLDNLKIIRKNKIYTNEKTKKN